MYIYICMYIYIYMLFIILFVFLFGLKHSWAISSRGGPSGGVFY